MQLDCPMFKIAVDNHNIFSVDGFRLLHLKNSEILKSERINAEGFVLPVNKVW